MHILVWVFLASFFIRLPFMWKEELEENLTFAFATTLSYGMIYFFVLEMRRLKDMLESDTKAMFAIRKTRNLQIAFFATYAVGNAGILIVFRIFSTYFKDSMKEH